MLTLEQFDRTRRPASSLAGIELVDRHRELLHRRSRRLGICDDAGLDALLCAAEAGEHSATRQLLCLLTTKFTGFFRHPRHFEIAAKHALQAATLRGQARLWSAGTATGEEAWSLAMNVIETFERSDPPVSILATDVEVEALSIGQRGEYGEAALRALDPRRLADFFGEPSLGRRRIALAARRLIEFRPLNLIDPSWSIAGPFDVIFCRNVLLYLEAGCRRMVLERLSSLLAPEGLLIVDPVEDLGLAGQRFAAGENGIYSLRPVPATNTQEGRASSLSLSTPSL